MNESMDGSSHVFVPNLMHDDDRIQRHVTTVIIEVMNYSADKKKKIEKKEEMIS